MEIRLKIRKERANWVFDDKELKITKESFVLGTSELIDFYKQKQKLEGKNLVLIVSETEFKDCQVTSLIEYNKLSRWSLYYEEFFGYHKLCPVLLKYFKTSPEKIFFKIEKE